MNGPIFRSKGFYYVKRSAYIPCSYPADCGIGWNQGDGLMFIMDYFSGRPMTKLWLLVCLLTTYLKLFLSSN